MLCWANENWTRTWDGGEKHILLEQVYSADDDRNHIKALLPFFKDPRYIRINNKPVFAVYRSALFPQMSETIRIWREEAAKDGIELYLCRCERTPGEIEAMQAGFDAAIEFQPQAHAAPVQKTDTLRDGITLKKLASSIEYRARNFFDVVDADTGIKNKGSLTGAVASYKRYVEDELNRTDFPEAYKLYRGVCPGWDNSARRKNGYAILHGSTPELFGKWMKGVLSNFPYSAEENLFFINAWNEWAEGNHLEPCIKWGRSYLETFRNTLADLEAS